MVKQNAKETLDVPERTVADSPAGGVAAPSDSKDYQRRLLAAIYDRMYQGLHAKGIPLIVQSIPSRRLEPLSLIDGFPHEQFATDRPGLYYLSDKDVLEPYINNQLLFWTRSQNHLTPFSQELAGKALAELILRNGLLGILDNRQERPMDSGSNRPVFRRQVDRRAFP